MATLDHIGIAVNAVPELAKLWKILGFQSGAIETVPDQGVRVHFFSLPGKSPHIELLEVQDIEGTPKNAIAKFIQKNGPGIHHLSFLCETGELDSLCLTLRNQGFRLIYETPRIGAQGMRINFIHPQTAGGVLIEIMEPVSGGA